MQVRQLRWLGGGSSRERPRLRTIPIVSRRLPASPGRLPAFPGVSRPSGSGNDQKASFRARKRTFPTRRREMSSAISAEYITGMFMYRAPRYTRTCRRYIKPINRRPFPKSGSAALLTTPLPVSPELITKSGGGGVSRRLSPSPGRLPASPGVSRPPPGVSRRLPAIGIRKRPKTLFSREKLYISVPSAGNIIGDINQIYLWYFRVQGAEIHSHMSEIY